MNKVILSINRTIKAAYYATGRGWRAFCRVFVTTLHTI